MGILDWPFVRFLENTDDFIVGMTKENEPMMAEIKDLISWYPHSCDCSACSFAEEAHKLLENGNYSRVKLDNSPFVIVVLDNGVTVEGAKALVHEHLIHLTLLKTLDKMFTSLGDKEQ